MAHGLRCFGRNGSHLFHRLVDFFAGGRLLLTGCGNGAHLIVDLVNKGQYLRERLARPYRKGGGMLNGSGHLFHIFNIFTCAGLYF